jgi:hypothetical protein
LGSLERLTGGSNLKNGRETGGITKIPPVPQPLCTKVFRAKTGGCEGKIVKTLGVTKITFGENLFLFGVFHKALALKPLGFYIETNGKHSFYDNHQNC